LTIPKSNITTNQPTPTNQHQPSYQTKLEASFATWVMLPPTTSYSWVESYISPLWLEPETDSLCNISILLESRPYRWLGRRKIVSYFHSSRARLHT
jgi:hypothetical protein